MSNDNDEIEKRYWTISEAAALIGVRQSHIRYYDQILRLNIERGHKRRRRLTKEMIDKIRVLVNLTKYLHLSGIKRVVRMGKLEALIAILND